jgi:biotin transporter BioY
MFRAFVLSLLAFLVGTIVVYLVLVAGIFTAWELTGYRDRDGGASMSIAFIVGPLIAIPAGFVIAAITWVKVRRSRRAPGEALTSKGEGQA